MVKLIEQLAYFIVTKELHHNALHIHEEIKTKKTIHFEQSFSKLSATNIYTALCDTSGESLLLGIGMGLVLVEQILWCLCPPSFIPPTRLFKDLLACNELQHILGPHLLGIIKV